MSAERGSRSAVATLALVCGLSAAAQAAAESDEAQAPPDMALLEYLGSWDESDEEWLLLSEDEGDAGEREGNGDAAPQAAGSRESDHES